MDNYKLNSFSEAVVSPDGKYYIYVLFDDINKVLHITETSYAIIMGLRGHPSLNTSQIIEVLKSKFEINIPAIELEKDIKAHLDKLCELKVLERV